MNILRYGVYIFAPSRWFSDLKTAKMLLCKSLLLSTTTKVTMTI